jgi:hypothetical protein
MWETTSANLLVPHAQFLGPGKICRTKDEGIGMQSKESRKELIREFKERKTLLGAYAVRCTTTGKVWVGTSRNLNATKNGTWFCLRNGSHQDKPLQEEWNAQGESSFQYEILDELKEDVHPLVVDDLLKEKKNIWVAQLGAQPLR